MRFAPTCKAMACDCAPDATDWPLTVSVAVGLEAVGVMVMLCTLFATCAV